MPNKGSLSQPAAEILREAGYRQRTDSRELTLTDAENGVEFFFLRPRDIALYVGEGTLDLGITGRDLLLDSRAKAEEVMALGFGSSRFRFAARPGTASTLGDLTGKRIATSYAGVVRSYLEEHAIDATVIRLDGAVETSIQLGVADVIADVVETGSTMRQAGLAVFGEVILASEAVLVTRAGAGRLGGVEVFRRRIEGVMVARTYVMMDYDIPEPWRLRVGRVALAQLVQIHHERDAVRKQRLRRVVLARLAARLRAQQWAARDFFYRSADSVVRQWSERGADGWPLDAADQLDHGWWLRLSRHSEVVRSRVGARRGDLAGRKRLSLGERARLGDELSVPPRRGRFRAVDRLGRLERQGRRAHTHSARPLTARCPRGLSAAGIRRSVQPHRLA